MGSCRPSDALLRISTSRVIVGAMAHRTIHGASRIATSDGTPRGSHVAHDTARFATTRSRVRRVREDRDALVAAVDPL